MSGTFQLTIHMFLQLTVILLTCRIAGRLLHYLGQTQVVSEMVAGVILGPSLLGILFPQVQSFLFPKILTVVLDGASKDITHPSMVILYALSQVGLVLYMFLIGLHLDTTLLTRHSRDAVSISISGILVPVVMEGSSERCWRETGGFSCTTLPAGRLFSSLPPPCPSRHSPCWRESSMNPASPGPGTEL